jgi:DNA-binding transcriptional LysR family regulator
MSLDRLVVFAAVAKHLNFSRASDALRITQPAVTKQIKLLEKEYDMTLFTRGGRGVQLTERGKVFLRDVKSLIKRYEKLKDKFGAVTSESPGQVLIVGGSYSPSASLLPSLLAGFEKSHPKVQLNLRTDNRLAVERMVLKGEVELAVINDPVVNHQLTMEPYRTESLVAFVRPRHPLAKKRFITLGELGRFGVVIRKHQGRTGTSNQYIKHLFKQGLRPQVILRCDTPEGVKEAVRDQSGVGILFREVVEKNITRGEFKAIKLPGEAVEGSSVIIYHKNRPLSPVAQEFLTLLRQSRQKS